MGTTTDENFILFCTKKLKTSEVFSLEHVADYKNKQYLNWIAEYLDLPELTVRFTAWKLLRLIQGHHD